MRFAARPGMSEIFVFINHFWLCAAVVSYCKPPSKWLRLKFYKTLKRIQNMSVFGNFRKFQKVKTIIRHLKFTTRYKFINILSTLLLKTVICLAFLVYLQILLEKNGTNQCLFKHWVNTQVVPNYP